MNIIKLKDKEESLESQYEMLFKYYESAKKCNTIDDLEIIANDVFKYHLRRTNDPFVGAMLIDIEDFIMLKSELLSKK